MNLVDIHGYSYLQIKKNHETVASFLNTNGNTTNFRQICTNQGGELAKRAAFRTCTNKAGYTLEITGAGASFKNDIVERPHRTLVDMMRIMLSDTNLSSDYWSYAIHHAIYINNQIPHRALSVHITPFQAYINRRPDLSYIRVLRSPVTVKQPRIRRTKLDTTYTTTVFSRFYSYQPQNMV